MKNRQSVKSVLRKKIKYRRLQILYVDRVLKEIYLPIILEDLNRESPLMKVIRG